MLELKFDSSKCAGNKSFYFVNTENGESTENMTFIQSEFVLKNMRSIGIVVVDRTV